jgi:L-alanine-DL-glutamate epimerase-like enolase superfamily enzyme
VTAVAVDGLDVAVEALEVSAYRIPTETHESDGTLEWDATTLVLVELEAGGSSGIGWTYAPAAAGRLVADVLAPVVSRARALELGRLHCEMRATLRNAGLPGLGAMALSAVDIALWDLKAKLLGLPLAALLGPVRDEVPVYGSGGFCSYTDAELGDQLAGWRAEGIARAKIKVGREPDRDVHRVRVAREAIGDDAELYVDANGAFTARQALRLASWIAPLGVTWFEEPVSSNDRDGLRLVRERGPAGMDVAAGEYASTPGDFVALAGVVDCLQADATRCGGVTGLLAAAAVAEAHGLDLSGHTAPSVHAHALAALPRLRHLEWFHDHVLIERRLFDGFLEPHDGVLRPDRSRPGLGVELRRADAAPFAV